MIRHLAGYGVPHKIAVQPQGKRSVTERLWWTYTQVLDAVVDLVTLVGSSAFEPNRTFSYWKPPTDPAGLIPQQTPVTAAALLQAIEFQPDRVRRGGLERAGDVATVLVAEALGEVAG